MTPRIIHMPVPFEAPTLIEADADDWRAAAGAVWEVIELDEVTAMQVCLVSEVWCRVASPGRADLWRIYRVRAQNRASSLARVAECIARSRAIVTIYEVTDPPTPETLGKLEKINYALRTARQRAVRPAGRTAAR